jgi:hypothetical protein
MSDKRMIDADEAKRIVCRVCTSFAKDAKTCKQGCDYAQRAYVAIDSLAQPTELERIDISVCKTCQEFCTTRMPLCERAKKEIGLDDSDVEPVKTEAIEACIRAYVGDLAKVAEAELEAIKKGNARCKVEHGMHINLAHCQK